MVGFMSKNLFFAFQFLFAASFVYADSTVMRPGSLGSLHKIASDVFKPSSSGAVLPPVVNRGIDLVGR